jgi:type II secretory pathway pseudopilin PulG
MNLKTQSGRSMVEMLGTLAIIGVLSIGGIAGYSYGMDKYRCNKTINDISLRRVDLMTQASQGRTTLSLSEWGKESIIYDISNPTYGEGGLIKFDVGATNKIPQSVCEMLFDGLSNTVAQIDINGTTSTSNDSCGENNTMTFYFAGGSNASGGTTGEQCGSTVCGTCQKCENDSCVELTYDYEQKCAVNGQSGWCVSGSCQPDTTCNCNTGYYCSDTNENSCTPHPSGTCVEAKSQFRTVDIGGTTYYISKDTMSWWDAVSACKALGNKKLLSSSDLLSDFDIMENGSGGYQKTALANALYNSYGVYSIWLKYKIYCSGYVVQLADGFVFNSVNLHDANSNSGYHYSHALCK